MQDPADAVDVGQLMAILSSTHQGEHVTMQQSTLKPPRSSTPGATLLPMWPQQAPITKANTSKSLFSLAWRPATSALELLPSMLGGQNGGPARVCTLSGAGTRLSGDGNVTLQLSCSTALVLDSSCDGVEIRNIAIAGALLVGPPAILAGSSLSIDGWQRCTLQADSIAASVVRIRVSCATTIHICEKYTSAKTAPIVPAVPKCLVLWL